MPHGTPDWGVDWTPRTVYGLEDLGEHAVRLRSPHLFDRQGDVLYLTDFRHGVEGVEDTSQPLEPGFSLWTGYSRQGAYALRMATNGLDDNQCRLQVQLALPVLSRTGFEYSFVNGPFTRYWYLGQEIDNGVNMVHGQVRLDVINANLEYLNDLGGWTIFETDARAINSWRSWNTFKLVLDFTRNHYVRCIYNNNEYDLSTYPMPLAATVTPLYLISEAIMDGRPVGATIGYLDNVIVTQNEP